MEPKMMREIHAKCLISSNADGRNDPPIRTYQRVRAKFPSAPLFSPKIDASRHQNPRRAHRWRDPAKSCFSLSDYDALSRAAAAETATFIISALIVS
jgi:hypothetical protein